MVSMVESVGLFTQVDGLRLNDEGFGYIVEVLCLVVKVPTSVVKVLDSKCRFRILSALILVM